MLQTEREEWHLLQAHAKSMSREHLFDLFNQSNKRSEALSFRNNDLFIDFSKQRISEETLQLLVDLANASQLQQKIEALFQGESVNRFEQRPALHMALRSPEEARLELNGIDIIGQIHEQLSRMDKLVSQLHSAQWRGHTGRPIRNLVHIGVGGSDLGPLMTNRALCDLKPPTEHDLSVHFVSSMDGSQLSLLLKELEPSETLFVIASKSFSTIDTMANADTALHWLRNGLGAEDRKILQHHFIGISANPEKMTQFGIAADNQLMFWEWVGGRYSLWSCIGFPIAARIGMDNFRQLLAGAHCMDEHFRTTPFLENIPVLLALIGIWNVNFLDIHAHAILPYDGRLASLPAYLEQLEMESNGKHTTIEEHEVSYSTCPIIWGDIGPNAQHAFYQLLHQGTERVMCDFIAPARRYHCEQSGNDELKVQHTLALSNCLAQSRVLAFGDNILKTENQVPAYKRYHGNQPSTTILLDELCPFSLGQLIALYEHKVFVQSVIWNINPFDQWGVELGKVMANETYQALTQSTDRPMMDQSTEAILREIQALQES
ncbi:glucose-6-phosphate isomerase [Marinobacterium jannaschii]|uniref:glucose-6-phosphate isomerase n=1 Tax=Marinobacterium jannaschii TaxID=64970 RepID=UPI000482C8AD|nr:glucose-6-phosphate isomerase [Marinobacterium jannaschii]